MLRRVAQALRLAIEAVKMALFVIGALLLMWLPASYLLYTAVRVPLPSMHAGTISGEHGVLGLMVVDAPPPPFPPPAFELLWDSTSVRQRYRKPPMFGLFRWERGTSIYLPLWLLSAICLAWPVTSFILARRKHKRGFPVEAKSEGEMFIVLLDEPGLFVFSSAADAAREIEPIDAETEVRAAFDESGVPYRVEWVQPNRHGRFAIEPGVYRFVPAGPADPACLARLLEAHSEHAQPSEASAGLRSLLVRLRQKPGASKGHSEPEPGATPRDSGAVATSKP